ncbi:MAG: ribosome maturation factor RimM [Paracoccaceae bacterium]
MSDDLIVVGVIAGAYGVNGEVRVKSFCAQPMDIETYSPLTDDTGKSYSLAVIRPSKNALITRIAEVTTKEAADALKGVQLFAQRTQLPVLPDDEYYHLDLIGLDVFDTGGTPLGKVKSVLNHGAADLLELHISGEASTVLLPFTQAVVPTVDLKARKIIADPPDGLF